MNDVRIGQIYSAEKRSRFVIVLRVDGPVVTITRCYEDGSGGHGMTYPVRQAQRARFGSAGGYTLERDVRS